MFGYLLSHHFSGLYLAGLKMGLSAIRDISLFLRESSNAAGRVVHAGSGFEGFTRE